VALFELKSAIFQLVAHNFHNLQLGAMQQAEMLLFRIPMRSDLYLSRFGSKILGDQSAS
jgi:hypothetical protein